MNILIISDIHGDAISLQKVIDNPRPYDMLLLVGDLMYHGPRNPLVLGYNPQEVANILNNVTCPILAVRGNCDAEVDQLLLDFPMMQDYSFSYLNHLKTLISHGHLFEPQEHALSSKCNLYITGHTHLLILEHLDNGAIMLNPGSIALPKGGNPASYAYFTEESISICTLDHEIYKSIKR